MLLVEEDIALSLQHSGSASVSSTIASPTLQPSPDSRAPGPFGAHFASPPPLPLHPPGLALRPPAANAPRFEPMEADGAGSRLPVRAYAPAHPTVLAARMHGASMTERIQRCTGPLAEQKRVWEAALRASAPFGQAKHAASRGASLLLEQAQQPAFMGSGSFGIAWKVAMGGRDMILKVCSRTSPPCRLACHHADTSSDTLASACACSLRTNCLPTLPTSSFNALTARAAAQEVWVAASAHDDEHASVQLEVAVGLECSRDYVCRAYAADVVPRAQGALDAAKREVQPQLITELEWQALCVAGISGIGHWQYVIQRELCEGGALLFRRLQCMAQLIAGLLQLQVALQLLCAPWC